MCSYKSIDVDIAHSEGGVSPVLLTNISTFYIESFSY